MTVRSVLLVCLVAGSVSAAYAPRADAPPVETVASLYRAYAWEAVIQSPRWPGHSLLEQHRARLEQFFDRSLTDLLLADQACAARTHSICALDFSPIWASQDPAATQLTIREGATPRTVRVQFRSPSTGHTVALSYVMADTPAGWRIHDIDYGAGRTLRALLSDGGRY